MLLTTSVGFVFFLLQPEMMPMEKMPSDKNKNTNEGDSVCLIVYKGIIVENKDTILYGNLNAKWLVFISASGSARGGGFGDRRNRAGRCRQNWRRNGRCRGGRSLRSRGSWGSRPIPG